MERFSTILVYKYEDFNLWKVSQQSASAICIVSCLTHECLENGGSQTGISDLYRPTWPGVNPLTPATSVSRFTLCSYQTASHFSKADHRAYKPAVSVWDQWGTQNHKKKEKYLAILYVFCHERSEDNAKCLRLKKVKQWQSSTFGASGRFYSSKYVLF
jgi:hypothetical protein